MKMQTFQADSMAGALDKVKQALGPEAVILHTRTLRTGGVLGVGAKSVVEITASNDMNLLHPAERRGIIGRNRPRPGGPARSPAGGNGGRPSRLGRSEGTVVGPSSPNGSGGTGSAVDVEAFTATLRGEMNELRAMVRELLDRSATQDTSKSSRTPAAEAGAEYPEVLREHYTRLIQNEVADEIAREVMAEARNRLRDWRSRVGRDGQARSQDDYRQLKALIPEVMTESIEGMLPPAEPINLNPDGSTRYVAFVGPTGVGKTTTIAKLAAHFKLREHKRIGLITTDTYRIAAVEQLKAYADILDVPLKVVMTPEEMETASRAMADRDLVLIDTSGRSQRDAGRLDELKAFLEAARQVRTSQTPADDGGRDRARGPDGRFLPKRPETHPGNSLEVHLVLSCTAQPSQMIEVVEAFSTLGIDRVVFAKLDEAVGAGVIINAVRRLNLQLSYLTTGQDVPDDIEVGHRRRIAELVLGTTAAANQNENGRTSSTRVVDHVA